MKSKCVTKDTVVGLEGGEFLLHPEATDILQWFRMNHPNFDVLSNCLKPDALIEAVKKYPPRRLYVSLDGGDETYRYMRGRNGYEKVLQVVEACRELLPISLMFTLSPYNNFRDMEHVVDLAQKYAIDVRIGVYNNIDFFETTRQAHQPNGYPDADASFRDMIPASVRDTAENYDFLYLYEEWLKKHLKLKCHSIFDSIVIHPNGDVPICQNLELKLGNIYESGLDDILQSRHTRTIQQQYSRNCNDCWINFHRKYDIVLLRTLERFIPKKMIELFYGNYQWCGDAGVRYRQLFGK
jgi:MoaA/NifB/PqqE/SkfB family radical SAM enzyme